MSLSSLTARAFKGRRALPAIGMVGALTTLVAGAVIYPGFSTTDVDLNDGSVWVTNRSMNLVAHLNAESKLLDGGFGATVENFDVVQNAGDVFMDNTAGTLLNKVDVPTMALGQDTTMSSGKTLSLGVGAAAITDPNEGNIWVMSAESVTSFGDKTTKPALTNMPGALAVVSQAPEEELSTVFVLNPRAGELLTLTVGADGRIAKQQSTAMAGLPEAGELELSAVGNVPVVLDSDTGTLFLSGNKSISLPHAKGAKLQQPSTGGNFAALETSTAMVVQPLNGGSASSMENSGTGEPIAPVQQNNCVHAAWSGSNNYLFHCAGGEATNTAIPHATARSRLTFRVNREVVVLNDTSSGGYLARE